MVGRAAPLTLAAVLVALGFSLFDPAPCHCARLTLSSLIFLTALFAWLSAQDLARALPCSLPCSLVPLLEFLVPLLLLDLALGSVWDPLECFLTNELAAPCTTLLACAPPPLRLLCSVYLHVALVYVLALAALWAVLRTYGVLAPKPC